MILMSRITDLRCVRLLRATDYSLERLIDKCDKAKIEAPVERGKIIADVMEKLDKMSLRLADPNLYQVLQKKINAGIRSSLIEQQTYLFSLYRNLPRLDSKHPVEVWKPLYEDRREDLKPFECLTAIRQNRAAALSNIQETRDLLAKARKNLKIEINTTQEKMHFGLGSIVLGVMTLGFSVLIKHCILNSRREAYLQPLRILDTHLEKEEFRYSFSIGVEGMHLLERYKNRNGETVFCLPDGRDLVITRDREVSFTDEIARRYSLGTGSVGEVWRSELTLDDGKPIPVASKKIITNRMIQNGGNGRELARNKKIGRISDIKSVQQEFDIQKSAEAVGVEFVFQYISKDDRSLKCCIVFEEADAGDLFQVIHDSKSNQIIGAYELAILLVREVEKLHAKGIIHGDLKPENIFMFRKDSKFSKPKVGDFGFATRSTTGFYRGKTATPEYSAPEIDSKVPYDQKADIFSLGVILLGLFDKKTFSRQMRHNKRVRAPLTNKLLFQDKRPQKGTMLELIYEMTDPLPSNRPTLEEITSRISKRPPVSALDPS